MRDARISQFNTAGALSGGEYVPIAQLNNETNTDRTVYTNPDAFKQFVLDAVADVFCPVGSIGTYASSVTATDVPNGWLLCNGQSVSRSTYSKLFDRIKTIYGSSSNTTFNVPNLKGKTVVGFCSSSSLSLTSIPGGNWNDNLPLVLGSVGGEFNHRLTITEIPIKQSPFLVQAADPISRSMYSKEPIYGGTTVSMNSLVTGGLKALFGGTLPLKITFAYSFRQACGYVTNNGAWQSLGCSGNNAWARGTVEVAPDSNGDVQFRVTDQGWGYQTLNITAYIPSESTLAFRENNINTAPFNTTQPYIVMNYIIKY